MTEILGYRIITNSKGDRWMKDGKFVSKDDVSEAVKKLFRKECFLCDQIGNHKRLLNGQQLPLCDEHYYQTTLGRLAQASRELGL